MRKEISQAVAKVVWKGMNKHLSSEANSASCAFVYQPKAPKGLEKFKNKR